MQIKQKRFSTTHSFTFEDESFNFKYKDATGSAEADIRYADLPKDSSTRIEKNPTWRNLGIMWLVIGTIIFVSNTQLDGTLRIGGLWFLMGCICLGVYHFTQISFTVFPINNGGVFIIQDGKTHDRILDELMTRRKHQLLAWLGDIDPEGEPEKEIAKFRWLVEQDVLSAQEGEARIAQVRALSQAPEPPSLLN